MQQFVRLSVIGFERLEEQLIVNLTVSDVIDNIELLVSFNSCNFLSVILL